MFGWLVGLFRRERCEHEWGLVRRGHVWATEDDDRETAPMAIVDGYRCLKCAAFPAKGLYDEPPQDDGMERLIELWKQEQADNEDR